MLSLYTSIDYHQMKLKAYKIDSTNKKVSHAAANKLFLPLANMTAGTMTINPHPGQTQKNPQ